MSSRFYSFMALFRAAMQAHRLYSSVPGNKFTFEVLCLLRQNGLIRGFSLDCSRRKHYQSQWHGYPRYKVYFTYGDFNYPLIKQLTLLPQTGSNFRIVRLTLATFINHVDQGEFLLLSSPSGLNLLSSTSRSSLPLTGRPIMRLKI